MSTPRGWWTTGYTILDKDHRTIAENLLNRNATLFLAAVALVDKLAAEMEDVEKLTTFDLARRHLDAISEAYRIVEGKP